VIQANYNKNGRITMRINQDHNTNNQDKYLLKIDPAFNY
jgi:hypothetical protein